MPFSFIFSSFCSAIIFPFLSLRHRNPNFPASSRFYTYAVSGLHISARNMLPDLSLQPYAKYPTWVSCFLLHYIPCPGILQVFFQKISTSLLPSPAQSGRTILRNPLTTRRMYFILKQSWMIFSSSSFGGFYDYI